MTDEEYEYLFRDADPRWKAYYLMRRDEYRKEHPKEICARVKAHMEDTK